MNLLYKQKNTVSLHQSGQNWLQAVTNPKISALTHAVFCFVFFCSGLASLQGSFLLNGNSTTESTSILQLHYFNPWFLGSQKQEIKENKKLTAAVKCLHGPTLTVRGGKCGPICIPERTGHRQTQVTTLAQCDFYFKDYLKKLKSMFSRVRLPEFISQLRHLLTM